MTISYRGRRDLVTKACIVEVLDDGQVLGRLAPRNDLRNHSPDGFEWGYGGSGPAQLALALAAHLLPDQKAVDLHQRLKRKIVAALPRDGWTLGADQLLQVLIDLQAEDARSDAELLAGDADGTEVPS